MLPVLPPTAPMLSPRWRKVLRDVWLHKARTALVVAAIAVGIIGAGAVLDTWSLLSRVTRGEYDASLPTSATLRTDSIDASLLALVRAMPALADAQARRNVLASARTSDGVRTALLMAADDFTENRIGKIRPERGAWPPTDGSIVVEASSVEFAGAVVGDSLTIQFGDAAPQRLRIAGVARDVGLAPGWMEHVVYVFVSRGTLRQIGAPASLNELQILARDRTLSRDAVRRVAADARVVIEGTRRTVTDVSVPEPGQHIHAAQINSLLLTQGAFGMLSLFLSGVLVVNLIAAMLAGQVREIGIMKAVGARAGQVAGMYLVLAMILGVVASVIAVPLAAVFGRMYAQFTADILNFSIVGFAIPAWVIVVQCVVGVVLPVVAAAIPVARGSRISVGEALRDLGISGPVTAAGPSLQFAGLSRPTLLSLRNAFRRRQRMVLTLLTLATGGAVYLGAINLRAGIIGSVDLIFESQRFDMSLRFAQPHPPDSVEAVVRRTSGVARAEAWTGTRGIVRRADGSLSDAFPITAAPAMSEMLVPRMKQGRALRAGDERALVVNRRLLQDEPSLVVDSVATILIGGRPTEWAVVGLAETGTSNAAYAPRATIAAMVGGGRVSTAVIADALTGPAAHFDLLQRLRSDLAAAGMPIQTGQLMAQQRSVIEDHLLMVGGFLGNMSLLMIIVGGLGLASTMSLSVLERTREIGVLRAIGAPHGAILMMVQVEGLVIALLSWLVAIPASLPMSYVLGKAFGRVMLEVPVSFVPEAAGVVRWLAVVVGVSVVACAWPALRAMRVSVAASLAYE